MKTKIFSGLAGARMAEGIAVIIDVFRASNTIISLLEGGAEFILPIGDLDEAYKLKKRNPGYLLFGERAGLPPVGFDFGNSPAEAAGMDLKNKKIILTTSAGSQGIVNAAGADEILIGSFANVKAIVNYLKCKNQKKVSLVAMGNNAVEPAAEDEECARYIKAQLEGRAINFDQIKKRILKSDGADRLRSLKQEPDLEFGLKPDIIQVIPIFDRRTGKITKVKN